ILATLAMFVDWLNPALVPSDFKTLLGQLKWAVLAAPIGVAVLARTQSVGRAKTSLAEHAFQLFLAWSLFTILFRFGPRADLIGKWISVVLLYLVAFVAIPRMTRNNSPRPFLTALLWISAFTTVGSLGLLLFQPGAA